MLKSELLSTPAKIRTWNRLIRSQVLYPVELRVHFSKQCTVYSVSMYNKQCCILNTLLTVELDTDTLKKYARRDSNPKPSDPKSDALSS